VDKLFGVMLLVVHSEKMFSLIRNPSSDLASVLFAFNFAVLGLVVMTRRPAQRFDMNPVAWLCGVLSSGAGIAINFLTVPGQHRLGPVGASHALAIAGMLMMTASRLSLGRSFALLPAARGIVTHGAYRLVRHPVYGSFFFSAFAVLLGRFSLPMLALQAFAVALVVIRAHQEERFLAIDPEYRTYMEKVKYRFIPFVY
jgi:protein-S-isoprenylcysteine O-methyltransferase Ste14